MRINTPRFPILNGPIQYNGIGTYLDDVAVAFGTGNTVKILWETADANANALLIQLPAGGAVDVPVIAVGQSIESVDLGLFNGLVNPTISVFGIGAVATGPVLEFRKARGTIASPTVVSANDDTGVIRGYAAVAAGEWVQNVEILFEAVGTIATTRGPGKITFKTGTDAAPSVLTNALVLDEAQTATFTGTIKPSASDGAAIGTSALMWSDLFLASGAVINFNNGDVTITHSANTLAFAGADSGYTFDKDVLSSLALLAGGALTAGMVAANRFAISSESAGTFRLLAMGADNTTIPTLVSLTFAEADGGGQVTPMTWSSTAVTLADAVNIVVNATTGTKIGTATTQKIGFWNATPVVQGAAVADAAGGATVDAEARTAINTLLARMRTYGLIAT